VRFMDLSKMTVAEVNKWVKKNVFFTGGVGCLNAEISYEELLKKLSSDSRTGIQRIYVSLKKKEAQILSDQKKLDEMFEYESYIVGTNVEYIAGVDEAGRGPLAGPVIAAAVILPRFSLPELCGLNDSKKVSERMRQKLASSIEKVALSFAVASAAVHEIDAMNIHNASLLAMKRAVSYLKRSFKHLLIDGKNKLDIDVPQTPIVGGDSKSASIAAASIIAKVYRDNIMKEYHAKYPQYNFAKHKGYPTDEHIAAIKKYGPCAIHRLSFLKKICKITK